MSALLYPFDIIDRIDDAIGRIRAKRKIAAATATAVPMASYPGRNSIDPISGKAFRIKGLRPTKDNRSAYAAALNRVNRWDMAEFRLRDLLWAIENPGICEECGHPDNGHYEECAAVAMRVPPSKIPTMEECARKVLGL